MQGLGVLEMQQKSELFERVNPFFEELIPYLQKDIELLESDARADSRFVTALVERTAKENLLNSIKNLHKNMLKENAFSKCQNYLERTKIFLEMSTQAADAGAYYIPVTYHTMVANQKREFLKQCNELLSFFPSQNINVTPNKKTWFNLHLHLGSLLTYIRALAFGLENDKK